MHELVKDRRERRRHQQEKKAERKAARTLSAVLLAFIITWTPYNVFIIVEAFCTDCVHPTLYAIGKSTNIIFSTNNRSFLSVCFTSSLESTPGFSSSTSYQYLRF